MPRLQIRGERVSDYGKGYIAMAIQEWGEKEEIGTCRVLTNGSRLKAIWLHTPS